MKKAFLSVIFLIFAIFTIGCSNSNANIESKQSDQPPTDIEIIGPAFVLFFTKN